MTGKHLPEAIPIRSRYSFKYRSLCCISLESRSDPIQSQPRSFVKRVLENAQCVDPYEIVLQLPAHHDCFLEGFGEILQWYTVHERLEIHR